MAVTTDRSEVSRFDPEKLIRIVVGVFVAMSSVILSAVLTAVFLGWLPVLLGLTLSAPFSYVVGSGVLAHMRS